MAKLYKAKGRFATSVTMDGELLWQHWEEGDERDLEPELAALLQREVPGLLVEVKAKAKKPKPVETAAGPTDDSDTRAVVGAGSSEKPPAKKAAKKKGKK